MKQVITEESAMTNFTFSDSSCLYKLTIHEELYVIYNF